MRLARTVASSKPERRCGKGLRHRRRCVRKALQCGTSVAGRLGAAVCDESVHYTAPIALPPVSGDGLHTSNREVEGAEPAVNLRPPGTIIHVHPLRNWVHGLRGTKVVFHPDPRFA